MMFVVVDLLLLLLSSTGGGDDEGGSGVVSEVINVSEVVMLSTSPFNSALDGCAPLMQTGESEDAVFFVSHLVTAED